MVLGTFGSTLNDELNRLANGGTYRTMASMVDEALAAKQWANRENINPYSTDTVGILNEIAGLGLDKKNWLDFNGVCNYIAGTTGLPAAAALRQVYNTTDLLTSQSAYYVDATGPYNWRSLGYIDLPKANGNYLSVPDSNALDITGDIDIRIRVALNDWTPVNDEVLISKWGSSNSYQLQVATDGKLTLSWSTTGSNTLSSSSSVATSLTDGSVKWVRVTLDVDNGASGRDVKFYISDDGSTWTQLGTTVTTAGTTSIFASTTNINISGNFDGANVFGGKFYRAQILNGIDGTTVLDVNIANDYTTTILNSFTATTGQTVTVNGIANLGSAGSLLPTTLGSSTAADSNDPKFLDFTGTNYVYLPGGTTNTLSVPDQASFDITGDLDIRVQMAMDDWTPSGTSAIIGNADASAGYALFMNTSGFPILYWYEGTTLKTSTATVSPNFADGQIGWIRVTLDVDNGSGSWVVRFYKSNDGITWTEFNSNSASGVTSISASAGTMRIGALSPFSSTTTAFKIYRAQVYNGIDGTKVLDVDTSVITAGSQTSFTAVTGQTVTINRSTSGRKTVAVTQPTWLFGTDDYMEVNNRYMASGTYLYLPGVASNYASTPDAAALDITGDIDLRVKVAMDDWTPAAIQYLLAKYGAAGQRSYGLSLGTNGRLTIVWSAGGTTVLAAESTVAPTIADGATLWVRATLDVDNGASGNTATFFTSDDGSTWTQLGTAVTTAGTTSIFNSTSVLEVGSVVGGTSNAARGKFFRAQVRNGIDGTIAFDANFETSITSLLQTSFTESSANAATVTINRSGSAYRSAGITTAGYLYPGATNTFTASATSFLDFGASDSFTALAIFREWATQSSGRILNKRTTPAFSSGQLGYEINNASATEVGAFIGDGTNITFTAYTKTQTLGGLSSYSLIVNRNTSTTIAYYNSSPSESRSTTTTGSLSNIFPLTIGRWSGQAANYSDMEGYAFLVFRQALSLAQIRQISNYFANREVYL